MKLKSKHKKSKGSDSTGNKIMAVFLHTQILSVIIYAASIMISSAVLYTVNTGKDKYYYILSAFFAVSSFSGGFYCSKRIRKKGLLTAFAFMLPINITVLLISSILNGFRVDFTALISFVILSLSAMLGGVISVNLKTKPKR